MEEERLRADWSWWCALDYSRKCGLDSSQKRSK